MLRVLCVDSSPHQNEKGELLHLLQEGNTYEVEKIVYAYDKKFDLYSGYVLVELSAVQHSIKSAFEVKRFIPVADKQAVENETEMDFTKETQW